MKLLLDTHVFIWLDTAPEKLSARALAACENEENELYLSVASVWEIQVKQQLKKITLEVPLEEMVQVNRDASNLQILPIELVHVLALSNLPLHHHDPFDRLLIAQAQVENAYLVSVDGLISKYPVNLLW